MVIVKLRGGLGNQMFQYAVARGIGKGKVYLGCSYFRINTKENDRFTVRKYELNIFGNLAGKRLSALTETFLTSRNYFLMKFRSVFFLDFLTVRQKKAEVVPVPPGVNIVLIGYFQSEQYFMGIREQLLKEFAFPKPDEYNLQLSDRIRSINICVSIHIRRADYLKPVVLRQQGILPLEYYQKAVQNLENELTNTCYFVFSDDVTWCKENLLDILPNYVIVDLNRGADSWKDMYLMSQCRHHIVANSSFSWWGAWLSKDDGLTIAPNKWFNPDAMDYNIDDYLPEKWRRIDTTLICSPDHVESDRLR